MTRIQVRSKQVLVERKFFHQAFIRQKKRGYVNTTLTRHEQIITYCIAAPPFREEATSGSRSTFE
jgi:hypothetical protein